MQHDASAPTQAGEGPREPIAIVGMSCRFAGGACSPAQLWHVLSRGVDATGPMPAERWNVDAFFADGPDRMRQAGKFYTRRGAFLREGVRQWDAHFFGVSPREARHVDPQQRLLLELAVEAMDDAGVPRSRYAGSLTGVYIGLMNSDYASLQSLGSLTAQTAAGSANSIAANRISYALDLRGPSITLDTACSSSMVAIMLAVQALRARDVDAAVCGGVNLMLSPKQFVALSRIGMISADGRCKPFSAAADGYGRGEGGGLLVLKRLCDAVRDGDHVYAELVDIDVNSDGRSAQPMLVPSAHQQAALMRRLYERAGVDPRSVVYAEAHGTGTLRGDPLEALGLASVLGRPGGRSARGPPLSIGSIKGNIGHTESAAGVAGLMKLALCAHHGALPPSLHATPPNPGIDFDALGIRVQHHLQALDAPHAFVGAVNSFGFGGTNAHAIVRRAAAPAAPEGPLGAPPCLAVALVSAASRSALGDAVARLTHQLQHLVAQPASPADAPHDWSALVATVRDTAMRRTLYAYRVGVPLCGLQPAWRSLAEPASKGPDPAHVVHQLTQRLARAAHSLQQEPGPGAGDDPLAQAGFVRDSSGAETGPPLVYVFGGSGCGSAMAGAALLAEAEAAQQPASAAAVAFAAMLRSVDAQLESLEHVVGQLSVTQVLRKRDDAHLRALDLVQSAVTLTAVELAFVAALAAVGVYPAAVLGYSLGEVAAAWVTGALTLRQALVLSARVVLVAREAELEGTGTMLGVVGSPHAVRQSVAVCRRGLAPGQSLAVVGHNSPNNVTLSGTHAALDAVMQQLGRDGITTVIPVDNVAAPYHCAHAFAPGESAWLSGFQQHVVAPEGDASPRFEAPQPPLYYSCTAGYATRDPLPRARLLDPVYWWLTVSDAVHFADAVAHVAQAASEPGSRLAGAAFLELSSRPVLTAMLRDNMAAQQEESRRCRVLPPVGTPLTGAVRLAGVEPMALTLAALVTAGTPIHWAGAYARHGPSVAHTLPAYPWQRRDFWHEGPDSYAVRMGLPPPGAQPVRLLAGLLRPLPVRSDSAPERVFQGTLSAHTWPALLEHAYAGSVLLAGAKMVQLLWAGILEVTGDATWNGRLIDLSFQGAVWLTGPDDVLQLRLRVEAVEGTDVPTYDASLEWMRSDHDHDHDQPDAWTRCFRGRAVALDPGLPAAGPPPLSAVRGLCTARGWNHVSGDTFYDQMTAMGFMYGRPYRCMLESWANIPTAVGRLRRSVPDAAHGDPLRSWLSTFELDAILQSTSSTTKPNSSALPMYIASLQVHQDVLASLGPDDCVWTYSNTVSTSEESILRTDVHVYADDGRPVCTFLGFETKVMLDTSPAPARPPSATHSSAISTIGSASSGDAPTTDLLSSAITVQQHPLAPWPGNAALRLRDTAVVVVSCDVGVDGAPAQPQPAFATLLGDALRRTGVAACDAVALSAFEGVGSDTGDDAVRRASERIAAAVVATGCSRVALMAVVPGVRDPDGAGAEAPVVAATALVLACVQAVANHVPSTTQTTLWATTREPLTAGACHGFCRVARLELRTDATHVCTLELPGLQGALSGPVLDAACRVVLAQRPPSLASVDLALDAHGHASVAVYTPNPLPSATTSPIGVDAGAAYVVIGGCSGLGLAAAHWLVTQHGARCLVLASRSGRIRGADDDALVHQMRSAGASVHLRSCDVTDVDAVQRLLAFAASSASDEGVGVRGVIHSAMVLDPGIAALQTWSRCHRVLAPKAVGALNVHRALESHGHAVDFFLLFSSLTSMIGNPGQFAYGGGNGCIDGLARMRRERGLPCQAINWGAFGGVGYLDTDAGVSKRLASRGIGFISRHEFLTCMHTLLASNASGVGIVRIQWHKWLTTFPGADVARQMQQLRATYGGAVAPPTATVVSNASSSSAHHVQSSSPRNAQSHTTAAAHAVPSAGERRAEFVRLVAEVMELAEDEVDMQRSLTELGGDSLMSMELRALFADTFGVEVPLVDLFNQTLQHVFTTLVPTPVESAPPQPPPSSTVPTAETVLPSTAAPSPLPSDDAASASPTPSGDAAATAQPAGSLFHALRTVMCSVLGLVDAQDVSREDTLLALGGDSILAMEVRSELAQSWNILVSVGDLLSLSLGDICTKMGEGSAGDAPTEAQEVAHDDHSDTNTAQSPSSPSAAPVAPVAHANVAASASSGASSPIRTAPTAAANPAHVARRPRGAGKRDAVGDSDAVQGASLARWFEFPLSEMQAAYFVGRSADTGLDVDGVACHFYLEYDSATGVDVAALAAAWNALVQRHDMLRATITKEGANRIHAQVPPFEPEVCNVARDTLEQEEGLLLEVRDRMSCNTFEPSTWPLFHWCVCQRSRGARVCLDFDHLIADLASVFVVMREWGLLYDAHLRGAPSLASVLPPLVSGVTYADVVAHLERTRQSSAYAAARSHWQARIDAGLVYASPPVAETVRDAAKDVAGGPPMFRRLQHDVSPQLWRSCKRVASELGVTATALVATVFAHVLSVYTGGVDQLSLNLVTFSAAAAHRHFRGLVGDMTSTMLLGVDLCPPTHAAHGDTNDSLPSLAHVVRATHERLGADLAHSVFPGVEVARMLPNRDEHQGAAFPVVFTSVLEGATVEAASAIGDLSYAVSVTPQVVLDCTVVEVASGSLSIAMDYLAQALPSTYVHAMLLSFALSLDAAAAPQAVARAFTVPVPASHMSMYDAVNSRAQSGHMSWAMGDPDDDDDGNQGDHGSSQHSVTPQAPTEWAGLDMYGRFEWCCDRDPDAPAVAQGVNSLAHTYAEVRRHSVAMGVALLEAVTASHRVSGAPLRMRDAVVALVLDPCEERVAAVLGVLWNGAAYLPLSTSDPKDRLAHILRASGAVALMTHANMVQRLRQECCPPGLPILAVEDVHPISAAVPLPKRIRVSAPDDLAYLIYTSGSTGLPKGVMIEQRSVINTIAHFINVTHAGPGKRLLALHAYTFDLSVWDFFGSLTSGAMLVLAEQGRHRDMRHVRHVVHERRVTHWNTVPIWMNMLLANEALEAADGATCDADAAFATLEVAMLSGDMIPTSMPARIRATLTPSGRAEGADIVVVCMGGPTEDTIWCTDFVAPRIPSRRWANMPYGAPIPGTSVHILQRNATQPVPIGVWGEMCFGGVCVSRGFLGDPVRTADRFVRHPDTGQRLHRTGDVGKVTPEGFIIIAGRLDNQVKVNGFRVELGEVETIIQNVRGVKQAGVLVVGHGSDRPELVACLVMKPGVVYRRRRRGASQGRLGQQQHPEYASVADFLADVPEPRASPAAAALFKEQRFGLLRDAAAGAKGRHDSAHDAPPAVALEPGPSVVARLAHVCSARMSCRSFVEDAPVAWAALQPLLRDAQALLAAERSRLRLLLYVVPNAAELAGGPPEGPGAYWVVAEHARLQRVPRCVSDRVPDALHAAHNAAWAAQACFHLMVCTWSGFDLQRDVGPLVTAGRLVQRLATQMWHDGAIGSCAVAGADLGPLLGADAAAEAGPVAVTLVCGVPSPAFKEQQQQVAQATPWTETAPDGAGDPEADADTGSVVLSAKELRSHLGAALPHYMIPTRYEVFQDSLPLSNNGKLDRRMLQRLVSQRARHTSAAVEEVDGDGAEEAGVEARASPPVRGGAPPAAHALRAHRALDTFAAASPSLSNALERTICRHWAAALGVDHMQPLDDFFDDMGGHSLAAVLATAAVNEATGVSLRPDLMFTHRTPRAMADLVRRRDDFVAGGEEGEAASGLASAVYTGREVCIPLGAARSVQASSWPVFCVHPAGGDVMCFLSLKKALDPARWQVFGLRDTSDSEVARHTSLTDMAVVYANHVHTTLASLADPGVPFVLLGYSFGGPVAVEMARHMAHTSRAPAHVVVVDTRMASDADITPTQLWRSAVLHFVDFALDQEDPPLGASERASMVRSMGVGEAGDMMRACERVWQALVAANVRIVAAHGLTCADLIAFVQRWQSHAALLTAYDGSQARGPGGGAGPDDRVLQWPSHVPITLAMAGDYTERDAAWWRERWPRNNGDVGEPEDGEALLRMHACPDTSHDTIVSDAQPLAHLLAHIRATASAPGSGAEGSPAVVDEARVAEARSIVLDTLAEYMPDATDVDALDPDANLFDNGLNSLTAIRIHRSLVARSSTSFPAQAVLSSPSVASLVQALVACMSGPRRDDDEPAAGRTAATISTGASERKAVLPTAAAALAGATFGEPIAIVGTAWRGPGALSAEHFWQRLTEGRDMTLQPGTESTQAFLDNLRAFDARFFGLTASEAALVDPQQRLFLETACEALAAAGVAGDEHRVAVFSTVSFNSYAHTNLAQTMSAAAAGSAAEFLRVMMASDKDYTSPRLAAALDLHGPALSVQSACSSALAAVVAACDALHQGRAHVALVGAASVAFPLDRYLRGQASSNALHRMFASDGRCRVFDAAAAGTSPGTGAGCFVLKPLSRALRDRDHVLCTIVGAAVNNDGARKAQFSQVSVEGQAELLRAAYASAGVTCEQAQALLSGYEAHGTATPLGDLVEATAIAKVLGGFRRDPSASHVPIGSVKSNVGHLDNAAGMAGLLKAAWALDREVLPPSLLFEAATPAVESQLAQAHMRVATAVHRLDTRTRPLFGVSAFGMGGTNVHLVLRSMASYGDEGNVPGATPMPLINPAQPEGTLVPEPPSPLLTPAFPGAARLVMLHAPTQELLGAAVARLHGHASRQAAHARARHVADRALAGLAFATQLRACGRSGAQAGHRAAYVASSWDHLAQQTADGRVGGDGDGAQPTKAPAVVFLLPGQGAQHGHMLRHMFAREPYFRRLVMHLCRWAMYLGCPNYGTAVLERTAEPAVDIGRTEHSQPIVFIGSLAMARTLMRYGVQPDAMVGHSLGEFVAATLAGVWTDEEGVAIVVQRGRLMAQAHATGAMAQLMNCSAEELADVCRAVPGLALAADNGAGAHVVSGPAALVAQVSSLVRKLRRGGSRIKCSRLTTKLAFHSDAMAPAAQQLAAWMAGRAWAKEGEGARQALRVPYVSNVTAEWQSAHQAASPDYYAKHMTSCVRFAPSLDRAVERVLHGDAKRRAVVLDVGPGCVLHGLARRHLDQRPRVAAVMAQPHVRERDEDGSATLLQALGALWTAGHDVNVRQYWADHSDVALHKEAGPSPTWQRVPSFVGSLFSDPSKEAPPVAQQPATAAATGEGASPGEQGAAGAPAHAAPADPGVAISDEDAFQAFVQVYATFVDLASDRLAEHLSASFYELGGSSLGQAALLARLRRGYGVALSFTDVLEHSSPRALWDLLCARSPGGTVARWRSGGGGGEATANGGDDGDDEGAMGDGRAYVAPPVTGMPLTGSQSAVWVEEAFAPDVGQYHMSVLVRWAPAAEPLQAPSMAAVVRERLAVVLAQHPLLSAALVRSGGAAMPRLLMAPVWHDVHASQSEAHRVAELRPLAAQAVHAGTPVTGSDAMRRRFTDVTAQAFALGDANAANVRVHVFSRLDDADACYAIVATHHLVSDGFSFGMVLRDLLGAPVPLPPQLVAVQQSIADAGQHQGRAGAPPAYASLWDAHDAEARALSRAEGQRRTQWWAQRLDGVPTQLPFVVRAARRHKVATRGGPLFRTKLGASVSHAGALAEAAKGLGVSSVSLHLAALATVLHRWSNQGTIVIGVAFANRSGALSQAVVSTITMLPVVLHLGEDPHGSDAGDCHDSGGIVSLARLARRAEASLRASLDHALPLSAIARAAGVGAGKQLFHVQMVDSPLSVQWDGSGGSASLPAAHLVDVSAGTRTQAALCMRTCHVAPPEPGAPGDSGAAEGGIAAERRMAAATTLSGDTALFSEAMLRDMADQLDAVLVALARAGDVNEVPFSALNLVPREEQRRAAVARMNVPTEVDPEADHVYEQRLAREGGRATVVSLIRAAAAAREAAPAVLHPDDGACMYTYGQLLAQAVAVARRLSTELGVRRGQVVVVQSDRSARLPVLLVAVMMAGAAYLPLSSRHPESRLVAILRESGAALAITDNHEEESDSLRAALGTADVRHVTRGHLLTATAAAGAGGGGDPVALEPSDTAYVLYTSGSTGTPKGVSVSHANVVTFLWAMQREEARACASDVFSCVHDLLFDFSVWEVFGALCWGAAVVMVPSHVVRSPKALIELVARCGVTVLSQTPTAFLATVAEERILRAQLGAAGGGAPMLRGLRTVVMAGDALDVGRLAPWFQCYPDHAPRVFNCYGITETSVFSTCHRIHQAHAEARLAQEAAATGAEASVIGKPMRNGTFAVLNPDRQLVPPGVSGELYIGGAAVADGRYLSGDTSRFVALDHVCPGMVFFRTGDVVRFDADNGHYDYLGRADHQIKMRGFRIEPHEVEQGMLMHPAVRDAVVVKLRAPPVMTAFVVLEATTTTSSSSDVSVAQLRAHAQQALPVYMVPQRYVVLPTIPTTATGKVDRRRLSLWSPAEAVGAVVPPGPRAPAPPLRAVSTSWAALVHTLSPLFGLRSPDRELPKYAFGSGGSTYAVRAYVHLLCRPQGCPRAVLSGDWWYVHPLLRRATPVHEEHGDVGAETMQEAMATAPPGRSLVAVMAMVGVPEAVEALYPNAGVYFTAVEAGCIAELVHQEAAPGVEVRVQPVPRGSSSSVRCLLYVCEGTT